MAEKIKLEIVTPDAIVVSEDVDEVTASGTEGEFGVLPGHCRMLVALDVGEMSYRRDGGAVYLSIGGGYAEVGPDKVTVLAETAELASAIDTERAREAKRRAEEALKSLSSEEPAYREAEIALRKAEIRLEVSEKAR